MRALKGGQSTTVLDVRDCQELKQLKSSSSSNPQAAQNLKQRSATFAERFFMARGNPARNRCVPESPIALAHRPTRA